VDALQVAIGLVLEQRVTILRLNAALEEANKRIEQLSQDSNLEINEPAPAPSVAIPWAAYATHQESGFPIMRGEQENSFVVGLPCPGAGPRAIMDWRVFKNDGGVKEMELLKAVFGQRPHDRGQIKQLLQFAYLGMSQLGWANEFGEYLGRCFPGLANDAPACSNGECKPA
jgi:hypothetical protein